MPWIKWSTKRGKEALLKNKGLPLGCHVLFWPNVHPTRFLLSPTCPAHKVNTAAPHCLALPSSSSQATHSRLSGRALRSVGILIQLLYVPLENCRGRNGSESKTHQVKPHKERKGAVWEAATWEPRAAGRTRLPLVFSVPFNPPDFQNNHFGLQSLSIGALVSSLCLGNSTDKWDSVQ